MLRALALAILTPALALAGGEAGVQYQEGVQLMQSGHCDEAATIFLRVAREAPRSEYAAAALSHAAYCREREGNRAVALELYQRVFEEYFDSQLASPALFQVAVLHEKSKKFEEAIARYDELVARFPAAPERPEAMFNSARLHEVLGHSAKAAAGFERYAQLFATRPDAGEALFSAARLYRAAKDAPAEQNALVTFLKRYGAKADKELVLKAKERLKLIEN